MYLYQFQIYDQTTLFPEKVQYIVQREYQHIVKTFIKTILINEREIVPFIVQELQPIVEMEFQLFILREILYFFKNET